MINKDILTQNVLDIIATYMDDDVREDLHSKLAPCEPWEFLESYIEQDESFYQLLVSEFGFIF